MTIKTMKIPAAKITVLTDQMKTHKTAKTVKREEIPLLQRKRSKNLSSAEYRVLSVI